MHTYLRLRRRHPDLLKFVLSLNIETTTSSVKTLFPGYCETEIMKPTDYPTVWQASYGKLKEEIHALLLQSLGLNNQSSPATLEPYDVARALLGSHITPLRTYQVASLLPEEVRKEVVQHLVFAGSTGLLPALRLLNTLRGRSGNWELALELLAQQDGGVLGRQEQRALTLITLLGGTKAFHVIEWCEMVNRAADNRNGEAALALHMLTEKKWTGPIETVFQMHNWEDQDKHDPNPSVWREIKWAALANDFNKNYPLKTFEETLPSLSTLPIEDDSTVVKNLPKSVGLQAEYYLRICGILMRRRGTSAISSDEKQSQPEIEKSLSPKRNEDFIITEGVRGALKAMARAICDGRPLVLEGEMGCGKTSLISWLARQLTASSEKNHVGAPDVTFIQMDSAMSSSDGDVFSSLIGGIVPLPQGGGFKWRAGPIGLAVERGEWLVFENIGGSSMSQASANSIICELSRLRPGDKLNAPGRGEPLVVGRGFRCLATKSTPAQAEDESWEPPGGWQGWDRISMPVLSRSEQVSILKKRFPGVSDCIERVVQSVSTVAEFLDKVRGPLMRRPNFREAVKICHRLVSLRSESAQQLSAENALLETIDILVAWIPRSPRADSLLEHVATQWSLSLDIAHDMFLKNQPSFSNTGPMLRVGRASMPTSSTEERSLSKITFNGHSARLLERVLRGIQLNESVLLTGEAGSGKTTLVQELARLLNKKLIVLNLSRQTESSDLVGGFRPVEIAAAIPALAKRFEDLFCKSMSRSKNAAFLDALQRSSRSIHHHARAIKLMQGACNAIPKTKKEANMEMAGSWASITADIEKLSLSVIASTRVTVQQNGAQSLYEYRQNSHHEPARKKRKSSENEGQAEKKPEALRKRPRSSSKRHVEFQFFDGALSKAMRDGAWVLLDEINLAPTEVLERLVSVVDRGQILLPNDKGEVLTCSPDFKLFGAMNPPTDVGKRPLPNVLRTRFTEVYFGEMTELRDIALIVSHRLFSHTRGGQRDSIPSEDYQIAEHVANFFIESCRLTRLGRLEDSCGRPARFSLRTLSRMLDYAVGIQGYMKRGRSQIRRALYEGAVLGFVTPLEASGRTIVTNLARKMILQRKSGSEHKSLSDLSKHLALSAQDRSSICMLQGYPIAIVDKNRSPNNTEESSNEMFVLSTSVKKTLHDVCRPMVIGTPRLPILLQGPTAAGKTSIVTYLSRLTGNNIVRINNHEHTDLSEYIGAYVCTPNGTLVFHEGPLVAAARNGTWVLLDELNLAPPEVLESLNRLLDDNREIVIPETGEVVKAADGFRVFATQNPPGLYGGRKELSLAFRSRFVEVQVPDLPDEDLLMILENRCKIPNSFARRMIAVLRELQIRRKTTNLFHGRDGFVTARDLFRWATRGPRSKEELAMHGFYLLGERARTRSERETVRNILASNTEIDICHLSDEVLYTVAKTTDNPTPAQECLGFSMKKLGLNIAIVESTFRSHGIVLTQHMRRMVVLLIHSLANREPALLVGTTGGGKTSCCASICKACNILLLSVNCHQHTEASDILGSFRPVRDQVSGGPLFEWVNGPLVQAMKNGSALLIDEINMAEDAVIERLNSVLELERTLLLSERGPASEFSPGREDVQTGNMIHAHPNFRIMATMNPGGDFGKRELSPALRNRFTEVWIPSVSTIEELAPIVQSNLSSPGNLSLQTALRESSDAICTFLEWVLNDLKQECRTEGGFGNFEISVRDVSSWTLFVREAVEKGILSSALAFVHGAWLVFLDGLSVGSNSRYVFLEALLQEKLLSCTPEALRQEARMASFQDEQGSRHLAENMNSLSFGGFKLQQNRSASENLTSDFSFKAQCTLRNSARLARAMVVGHRPVLLEGPPGCGKSSLVKALAERANFSFVRINLSESTEMSDLVGTDAPGEVPGTFSFRPGPLLVALSKSAWVLLDELNLASQSVLEGLNSVLDHRRSLYVPELGREVQAHKHFRVFGAQNPAVEGGGRRGLPKSFLNRFTKVKIEAASEKDIVCIVRSLHKDLDEKLAHSIVRTLHKVKCDLTSKGHSSDQSSFGLRDALRWCDLFTGMGDSSIPQVNYDSLEQSGVLFRLGLSFDVVVLQGLTPASRIIAEDAFKFEFGHAWRMFDGTPAVHSLGITQFRVGGARLNTSPAAHLVYNSLNSSDIGLHPQQFRELQALSFCVNAGWPAVLYSDRKTSCDSGMNLIRTLATMKGRRLSIFHGSSLSDFDEFVGGYIQQDREWLMQKITTTSEYVLLHHILCATPQRSKGKKEAEDAVRECLNNYQNLTNIWKTGNSTVGVKERGFFEFLDIGWEFCNNVSKVVSSKSIPQVNRLNELLSRLQDLVHSESVPSGSFKWSKSDFIHAIESGDWIVLEDADVCPPAVLDRLNPLLERPPIVLKKGVESSAFEELEPIILAEAPTEENGTPVMMKPHPDFRIFFLCRNTISERRLVGLSGALLDRSLKIYVSGSVFITSHFQEKEAYKVKTSERIDGLSMSELISLGQKVKGDVQGPGTMTCEECPSVDLLHSSISSTGLVEFVLNPEIATMERELLALRLSGLLPMSTFAKLLPPVTTELESEQQLRALSVSDCLSQTSTFIRNILVKEVAKRFLFSSRSIQDCKRRIGVLQSLPEMLDEMKTSNTMEDICDAFSQILTWLTSAADGASRLHNLVYQGLPLDPLYSCDSESVYIFHESSPELRVSASSQARRMRLIVNCTFEFQRAWERANQKSKLSKFEGSMFAMGKLENASSETGIQAESLHAFLYRILGDIKDVTDHVHNSSIELRDWSLEGEVAFDRIITCATQICNQSIDSSSTKSLEVRSLMVELGTFLKGLDDQVDQQFGRVSSKIASIQVDLWKWRNSSTLRQIRNLPRTESAQQTEKKLLLAESLRTLGCLSAKEVDAFVKALSSLCAGDVYENQDVLMLLEKVGRSLVISNNRNEPRWEGMSHWNYSSQVQAVKLFDEGLRSLLLNRGNQTATSNTPNTFASSRKLLSEIVLQANCLPSISLDSLISVQNLSWEVDSIVQGIMNDTNAPGLCTYLNAAIINLLAEKARLNIRNPQADENSSKDVPLSSVLKSSVHLEKDPARELFWNMGLGRRQSLAAMNITAVHGVHTDDDEAIGNLVLLECLSHAAEDCGMKVSVSDRIYQNEYDYNAHDDHQIVTLDSKNEETNSSDHGLELPREILRKSMKSYICSKSSRPTYDAPTPLGRRMDFLGSLGETWVGIAVSRMQSMHNRLQEAGGLDPSLIARISASSNHERGVQIAAGIAAHIIHGACRLGGANASQTSFVQLKKVEFEKAISARNLAERQVVFRPDNAASFHSFVEASNGIHAVVMSRILKGNLLARLRSTNGDKNGVLLAHEEANDLYQICGEAADSMGLLGSLSHFRDVSQDLVLGLRELQYGLSCLIQASQLSTAISRENAKVNAFYHISLYPRAASVHSLGVISIARECILLRSNKSTLFNYLTYAIQDAMAGFHHDNKELSTTMRQLAEIWKKESVTAEKEKEIVDSLFVLREVSKHDEVKGNAIVDELEIDEEEDYKKTFNPIGEDMEEAMLGVQTDQSSGGQREEQCRQAEKECKKLMVGSEGELWDLHESTFPSERSEQEVKRLSSSRRELLLQLSSSIAPILEEIPALAPTVGNVWNFLSAQKAALSFENCVDESRGSSNEPLSFYAEAQPDELLRASSVLRDLNDASLHIQKTVFEDSGGHPVLGEVISAINRVAQNCRMNSPLSTVILGLENVLRRLDEWRRLFATKATRLEKEGLSVSMVVASWRRKEIESWKTFLDRRLRKFSKKATKWFFYLFDAIIVEATSSELAENADALNEIASVVDRFLRSSPTGEFLTRLEMIGSLATHLRAIYTHSADGNSSLAMLLTGITKFYGLYHPVVSNAINSSKEIVQGKLDEFSRLQTWKSDKLSGVSEKMKTDMQKHLEYYRLKSASERTKRKLHKYCLEIDSMLRLPVYDHISRDISSIGLRTLSLDDSVKTSSSSKQSQKGTTELVSDLVNECLRSLRQTTNVTQSNETLDAVHESLCLLSRLGSFQNRLGSLGKDVEGSCHAACDIANSFIQSTRTSIKKRTEALNKTGVPVQAKRRALVELLKVLRSAGLTPFERKVESIMKQPSVWLSSPDPSTSSVYNEFTNRLFFIGAQRVRRVIEVSDSRIRNADITTQEAERARAFCLDLFQKATLQRKLLQEARKNTADILEIVRSLQSISIETEGNQLHEGITKGSILRMFTTLNGLKKIQVDFRAMTDSVGTALRISKENHNEQVSENPQEVLVERQQNKNIGSVVRLKRILADVSDAFELLLSSSSSMTIIMYGQGKGVLVDGRVISAFTKVTEELAILRSTLRLQLSRSRELSTGNFAIEMIKATLQYFVDVDAVSQEEVPETNSTPEEESQGFDEIKFFMIFEDLIRSVLLGSQNLMVWNGTKKNSKIVNYEDNAAKAIANAHKDIMSISNSAHLDQMLSQTLEIQRYIGDWLPRCLGTGNARNEMGNVLKRMQHVLAFIIKYINVMVLPSFARAYEFHCHSLKLLGTLSALFTGLCQEGFCRSEEEVGDGDSEENVQDISGAGFADIDDGDISNAKDVSSEVEDEEQLLGLQDLDKEQIDHQEPNTTEQKEGLDMTNDFEGALEDLDDDGEEPEQENEMDVDEEMGKDGEQGQEDIDERLWDGEDDEGNNQDPSTDENSVNKGKNDSSSNMLANTNKDEANNESNDREKEQTTTSNFEDNEANLSEGDNEMGDEQDEVEEVEPRQEVNKKDKNGADLQTAEEDKSTSNEQEVEGDDAEEVEESKDVQEQDQEHSEPADAMDDEKNEPMSGIEGDEGLDNADEIDVEVAETEKIPDDMSIDDGEDDGSTFGNDNIENSGGHETLPEENAMENDENMDVTDGNETENKEDIPKGEKVESQNDVDNMELDNNSTREQHDSGTKTTNDFKPDQAQLDDASLFAAKNSSGNPHKGSNDNDDAPDGMEEEGTGGSGGRQEESGSLQVGEGSAKQDDQWNELPNVNPHRAISPADALRKWKRFLEMTQEDEQPKPKPERPQEADGDAGQFLEQEDSNPNDDVALGAATEDQHRPFPESKGVEEDQDDMHTKSKTGDLDKESAKQPEAPGKSHSKEADNATLDAVERDDDEDVEMEAATNDPNVQSSAAEEAVKAHEAGKAETDQPEVDVNAALEINDMEDTEQELLQGDERSSPRGEEIREHKPELSNEEASKLWQKLEQITQSGSSILCEQLRLVLEPTIASGLAGGYRTGKRLNIRKVIEFVASDYRKDRIWLRRVRPDKRSYDVLLAIDDSESMSDSGAGPMAIESLALITSSLSKLEVGRLAVASFGKEACLVRGFDEPLPLSDGKGGYLLQQFTFRQKETNVANLLKFIAVEMTDSGSGSNGEHIKLVFVISDGRLSSRDEIKSHVRRLREMNILVALIIVDNDATQNDAKGGSIYDMKRVEYTDGGTIKVLPYMQDFPINYYTTVHEAKQLPAVLADALRQWIEVTSAQL